MDLTELTADDDDAVRAYADLVNACDQVDAPPGPPLTAHGVRNELLRGWDGEPDRLFLARDGGDVVGGIQYFAPTRDNPEAVWLQAQVLPALRRQGLGTALLRATEDLCRGTGRTLLGIEGWETPAMHAFAERHGYPVAQVTVVRDQHLGGAPPEPAAAASGYELVRLEGRTPDDLLPGLVAATAAINDAPLDDLDYDDEVYDEDRIRTYEQAQLANGCRFRRVVAVHLVTGTVAGHTVTSVDAEQPRFGEQHDTTVVPGHRGHRLGFLLKAEMLRWLAEVEPDLRLLRTENAESNGPMIEVNERLGYQVAGRRLIVQRRI